MIKRIAKEHFPSIDSTHSWALRQEHRLMDGMLLMASADEQTAGRGRYGKTWYSPRGQGLIVTFSFLIDKNRHDSGNIPQVLALSTAKVLSSYGLIPQLKWPNDLLINYKKIGGILASARPAKTKACMHVSLGLNVTMPLIELEKLGRPATSLLVEMGKTDQIENIREAILNGFILDINQFLRDGFRPFLETYRAKMAPRKGSLIHFHMNGSLIEGIFEGINENGTLQLSLHNGNLKEFSSGELII